MSVSNDKLATNSQETARLLGVADGLFLENLSAMARRGQVPSVRESAIYLAYVRTLQTSVGRESADVPLIIANLLGRCIFSRSLAIRSTLGRRERRSDITPRDARNYHKQVPAATE